MKRNTSSATDFSTFNLAHNRKQVFFQSYKLRFGLIMLTTVITFLFFLPLFFWNTYARLGVRYIALDLETAEDQLAVYSKMLQLINFKNLINLPLFAIAGIGIGGSIHIFQKIIWSDIVFISDYFENFKKNVIKYLIFGLILGIGYLIYQSMFYMAYYFPSDAIRNIGLYALSILIFAFIAVFDCFLFMQNEVYNVKFFNLIGNAIKFTFNSFIPILGFGAIAFLPYILVYFENLTLDGVSVMLFILFYSPSQLCLILFSNHQFDKYINKNNFPDIVDKGIYRNY